jgi:hypothetical protein
VVIAGVWLRTRYGYLPLQRLYLSQDIKASIKSLIPLKRPSKYMVLVRVIDDHVSGREQVIDCTDELVTSIRDENGH